ncbi:MAG TPA: S8 family peptidase [Aromatoleum sp.]|uniref:S8 family peptidase n=1 Tax=Aromatoleum sp. TaxID=2307007 RepID=UPI002B48D328|nr:S8 family peptidase [Aromatoleum sp.]HJV27204.1 S8 family peptidase [Aromatoleum sp.]
MKPYATHLGPPQLALLFVVICPPQALAEGIGLQMAPPSEGEIRYGSAHAQIGADLANAAGLTGLGSTVALLDTGIQANLPELASQLASSRMYDATRRRNVALADDDGHGTLVAAIIAGSSGTGFSYGIAPDAKILPIKIFSADGSATVGSLAAGLKRASSTRGASIINLSLGAEGPLGGGVESALRKAVKADKLVVAAAGNSGGDSPLWPARYAKEGWAKGQIVAVGAVDGDNRIASFSNRAGDTANWFLVAPGVDVVSSGTDGSYIFASGTSISTAIASGAAALLEGAWPQLKARQVAAILLETATDLGEPGIDPVYGRGLLNVQRAMQPAGALAIPVSKSARKGSTKRFVTASAAVTASVATWSGLHAATRAGLFQGIAVDAFNRDFAADLGTGIRPPPRESIADVLAATGRPLQVTEQQLPDGSRLLAVSDATPTLPRTPAAAPRVVASSLVLRLANGSELAFASGTLAGSYFGLASAAPRLDNPWLGLARPSAQLAFGTEFGKLRVRSGVLASGDPPATPDTAAPTSTNRAGGQAAIGELEYALTDSTSAGLQWTQVSESNSFLGASSGDSMGLDGARTRSVGAWASHRLTDSVTVAGQYSVARSEGQGKGLIRAFEGVRANAFAFALIGRGALVDDDRLTLTFSSPMRINAGNGRLNVPVDVNADGDTIFQSRRIPLAATHRELRLGIDYGIPLPRTSSLSFTFDLRHNADHVAGRQDAGIAVIFRRNF